MDYAAQNEKKKNILIMNWDDVEKLAIDRIYRNAQQYGGNSSSKH
jgi:hypothetical protein